MKPKPALLTKYNRNQKELLTIHFKSQSFITPKWKKSKIKNGAKNVILLKPKQKQRSQQNTMYQANMKVKIEKSIEHNVLGKYEGKQLS